MKYPSDDILRYRKAFENFLSIPIEEAAPQEAEDAPKKGGSDEAFDAALVERYPRDIPISVGKYDIKPGQFKIDDKDLPVFKELAQIKPSNAGGGVGYGEIAIYWLFNYNKHIAGKHVATKSAGGAADLSIRGIPVEIKSYPNHDKQMVLGKYKSDVESRNVINKLFGLTNLLSILGGDNKRIVSEVTFNIDDLVSAYSSVINLNELFSSKEVKPIVEKFEVLKNIKVSIDFLLQGNLTSEQHAQSVVQTMLMTKLSVKPGMGGYIMNLKKDDRGDIWVFKVDAKKLTSVEELGKFFVVYNAEIYLDLSIFN